MESIILIPMKSKKKEKHVQKIPALQEAILAQNSIGWDNILKGRLSIKWATMYYHIITATNHGLKHPTAEKWGAKILELSWQFFLNC
jgi:hypothetical protein